ncbi:MAG: transcription termination factor Rho [Dasania sp.]|jgi:transcription termination factor Rho
MTQPNITDIKLKDLKKKTAAELLVMAEEMEIDNAGNMRRQDSLFAVLNITPKKKACGLRAMAFLRCFKMALDFYARTKQIILQALMIFMYRRRKFVISAYAQATQ